MLQYLYYQLYRLLSNSSGLDPKSAAAMYLGGLISLNIFSVVWCLGKLGFNRIPSVPDMPIYEGGFALLISLLFVFYYCGKRADRVIKKYENANRKQNLLGGFLFLAYFLLSFAAFIVTGFWK